MNIALQSMEALRAGVFDDLVIALPDFQGRLMGLRRNGIEALRTVLAGQEIAMCGLLLDPDEAVRDPPAHGRSVGVGRSGDVHLVVDPSTLRPAPWWGSAACVLADPVRSRGRPVPLAPRLVLRDQLRHLDGTGLVIRCWLVLDMTLQDRERTAAVEQRVSAALRSAQLPVTIVATGRTAPSHRMLVGSGDPLMIADACTLARTATAVVTESTHDSSFMAQPEAGSAQGLAVRLDLHGPTVDGATWARDTLASLPALALLWAPTINSSKHLRRHAPPPAAAIRIDRCDRRLQVDLTAAGADANVHLVVAGLIAMMAPWVGCDTIGVQSPDAGADDLDEAPHAAGKSDDWPLDLPAALAMWRSSGVAARLFGPLVTAHIASFAEAQLNAFQQNVSDWERQTADNQW